MPWYRTGKVAITAGQNTVTGTDTNFSANARVGDAFQGPDGRWYEVTNIASSKVLSILPVYQGETVAAGSYGLAPMQGYVKESADRLRAITDGMESIEADVEAAHQSALDAAASATAAGALADQASQDRTAAQAAAGAAQASQQAAAGSSTSAGQSAQEALGYRNSAQTSASQASASADAAAASAAAAAESEHNVSHKANSGANSDITSLSGLTTPLSVGQGGTGGTTQAAARDGLGLKSAAVADILGTVSQTGGVPTGAIIEEVSNANGVYVKLASGSMICYGRGSGTTGTELLNHYGGGGITYANVPIAFPAVFANNNYSFVAKSASRGMVELSISRTASGCTAQVRHVTANQVVDFDYVVVGRWF